MRSFILAVLLVVALAAGAYSAETMAGDVDPYMKVATARAKAEMAIRDGQVQFDPQRNSWDASWQAQQSIYEKTRALLEGRRNQENQKGDQADRQLMDNLSTKMQTIGAENYALGQTEGKRVLAEQKMREAKFQWDQLRGLFSNVRGGEESWKNCKLDLSPLVALYASIETRAIELRGEAASAVGTARAVRADWEAKLPEVEKLAGAAPAAQ